jgi:hypothetical protein
LKSFPTAPGIYAVPANIKKIKEGKGNGERWELKARTPDGSIHLAGIVSKIM